jgi:hypothetical protein
MRPTIEILYPDGRTDLLELSRERTVIGRGATAHIRIEDSRVSREHCVLEADGDRIYVVDLGGNNGTWVGGTKILPNMREPFPQDLIVHVGPAQLRNVTSRLDPGNDLESRAFMPVAPRRESSDRGRPAAGSSRPQSAATIDLHQPRVKLAPGERGSLKLTVSNQSKIVDHYTLSVSGAPTTWVTLPRSGVELLPRESGDLNIDLHPPRHSRTSAGIHRLSIALLNKQKQIVCETTGELEVAPFDNLILDVRPNPYESRWGADMVLTVENQGNAQTDYRVSVIEPSDSAQITVEPPMANVAPQQSRQSIIRVRPRKRIWVGQPRRLPLTVTVSSNLQSVTAAPVYTQLATIPPVVITLLGIFLFIACCVLIPLFSFLAYNPYRDHRARVAEEEQQTRIAPTLAWEATLTAQPTITPTPDTPATVTATWLDSTCNGDRLTNREKLEAGLILCEIDSDDDGLSDFDELKNYGTNPLKKDTSGDGINDGEVVRLKDEGEPREWYSCLSPTVADANGDGTPNGSHLAQGTNPCAGAAPTATPAPTPVRDFALGGHIRSADNLGVASEAGMTWVKVQLRYSRNDNPESAVRDLQEFKKSHKLLVTVLGHKEHIAEGGAGYMQQYAEFASQVAAVADAIEVWNEPNIQDEWMIGQINPGQYTELLRYTYQAIKSRYPTTLVVSGALAPTGYFGGGCRAEGCDDSFYLAGMFAAGAANYMDCIGVHYNAGATEPSATSGHPADNTGLNHYSWYFLPMLDLYWNTFNPPGSTKALPLCFTEIGYVTPQGMSQTLAQAGATNFLWAEGVTLFHQGIWLADALQRACHSGKVRLFIVWNVDFEAYDRDPQAAYAILRPDGKCPTCANLKDAVNILRRENCMA